MNRQPGRPVVPYFEMRLLLLTALAVTAAPLAVADEAAFRSLDQRIQQIRVILDIPGLQFAVFDGEALRHGAHGLANMATQEAMQTETLVPVASVTKPMAAVVAMQLVKEGQLSLDAPMTRYREDLDLPDNVLLRHVLSHTSDGRPGEQYLYNGGRYSALTGVLARAGAAQFADLLRSRVFEPAGMTDCHPGPEATPDGAQIAQPYQWSPDQRRVVTGRPEDDGVWAASGAVCNTTSLLAFSRALDDDTLLDAQARDTMWTPAGPGFPYALGWFVQRIGGRRVLWHFGQADSYSSLLIRIPDKDLHFAALANTNAMSDAARLLDGDLRRSLPALAFLQTYLPDLDLDADQLLAEALAHVYLQQPDRAVQLFERAVEAYGPGTDLGLPALFLIVQLDDRRFDETAERISSRLLAKSPYSPPAAYLVGTLLLQQGRDEEAHRVFERLDREPRIVHWASILAWLELGQQKKDKEPAAAREYFERVVRAGWNVAGAVDSARAALAELP